MVQRPRLGHRLCLRYVIALVLGALSIYTIFRRPKGQNDVGIVLSDNGGTALQDDATISEKSPRDRDQTVSVVTSPSPRPDTSPSVDNALLHVIISHFEEDPFYIRTWLDDFRAIPYVQRLGLHVTIYTKGSLNPEQIKGVTAAEEVVQLPNAGREGGTYLHHILKHYEDPPPFTLFTQAYLKKVQQEGTGEQAGHFTNWIKDRLTTKFNNATGFMSMDRKHDVCYCGHCTDINKDFYPLWPQLYTLITGSVCQHGQPTILSFNGHFIVSRKRILARPRQVYEYLQELVDAPEDHWIHAEEEPKWFNKMKGKSTPSNPKFGHTLERLWHTLFACDSPDVVEDCDIEGLKVEGVGGFSSEDVAISSQSRMPITQAPKRGLKKGDKKGPGKPTLSTNSTNAQTASSEIQQWILDIFRDACSAVFNNDLRSSTIQEIKQHLFERDFDKAFGNPAYLDTYAARWSPTRALCYLEILCSHQIISDRLCGNPQSLRLDDCPAGVGEELSVDSTSVSRPDTHLVQQENPSIDRFGKRQRIVCLGAGGGAELAAFAGFLRQKDRQSPTNVSSGQCRDRLTTSIDCAFVDAADWSSVLSKLHSSTVAIAPMSSQISTTTERLDGNHVSALQLHPNIIHQDILKATQDDMALIIGDATLVTIMFTVNELYSTSIGSTTKMLLTLTSLLERGALLLVVDSPGSYSTVSLGAFPQEKNVTALTEARPTEQRYPMQWLLDRTLLDSATIPDSENKPHKQWTKLESDESKWFRLPRLQYPMELEDMRYQLHLYQRL